MGKESNENVNYWEKFLEMGELIKNLWMQFVILKKILFLLKKIKRFFFLIFII